MAQTKTLKILAQANLTAESRAITNRVLTSNVATITTATSHNIIPGNLVVVSGIDSTFNGNWNTVSASGSTFTYAVTASNVVSASVSGASVSYVPATTIYTTPVDTQTLISTISVTNTTDVDGTFFIAAVKSEQTLDRKHYIAWGPGILARDNINITAGITLGAGDTIVAFGSANVAISLFGGEIV
jgi:hypothetical protein